jgi:hypothetical protein
MRYFRAFHSGDENGESNSAENGDKGNDGH